MLFIYFLLISFVAVFFVCFVALFVFQVIAEFTTDAPFVPVPASVEEMIVESFALTDDSVLYDLGCGDARILLRAVQKFPHIRAVGVEISFIPYLLAKFRTRAFKNITIRRENIFTTKISDATHIFVYLYPQVINRLMPRIRTECTKGITLVSCDFELTDQEPERVSIPEHVHGVRGQKILIYKI
jgi:hypothetical protein